MQMTVGFEDKPGAGLLTLELSGFRDLLWCKRCTLVSDQHSLMFDACRQRSWIGSLDWYLHWKIGREGRPHWRPVRLCCHETWPENVCLHISSHIPGSRVEKGERKVLRVIHIERSRGLLLSLWEDFERQHRQTADWRYSPLTFLT